MLCKLRAEASSNVYNVEQQLSLGNIAQASICVGGNGARNWRSFAVATGL